MKNEPGFADGFGTAFLIVVCFAAVFTFGNILGYEIGKSTGEKNMALLTVQVINKIEKQLPQGTKIENPFTEEMVKDLGYDAQNVLKLIK
jgi:hypothetical protein